MCGKEGGDGERGEVVELVRELLLRGMTGDDSGVMIMMVAVSCAIFVQGCDVVS